jgi:phosphopantothenoylcysteine decarboxylase/phosphopantothenate--cysteine ligase
VTAGATSERVDPVRVLTNRASGRTGRAVARACYVRGADVTLVHDGDAVPYAAVESVESAAEMTAAAEAAAADADALVSAAAIGDYTVEAADEKLRSGRTDLTLALSPTPKLLDAVRETHPSLPMVGFKLEPGADDEALIRAARDLRERVALSFVVANDAEAMGGTETRALFVDDEAAEPFAGSKTALGWRVADELAARL